MADFIVSMLMVQLGFDTSKFSAGMKKTNQVLKKSSQGISKIWKKGVTPGIKSSEKAMKDFQKTTRRAVKDISRVVTGILISQAFHNLLGIIKDGIKAVITFSVEMEKAAIAFTQLLGSTERAKQFLSALEDLAAVTPIQITPLKQGAQQLLAMGFAAKDVIPTLRTLVDTIAASGGGNEQLIQATRVFGKIKAMGKLSAREIRSLAVLNIPIQDILKKELKLTAAQIREIGRLKIPAEKAIGAILTGMDKRFAGLAALMARTMGGLISTIKDNLLFIGRDLFASTFDKLKQKASSFLDTVQALRDITKVSGAAGFLRAVFSPATARTIELFGKSIKSVGSSFKKLMVALKPLVKAVGVSFLAGLTAVATILAAVIGAIASLTEVAMKSKIVVLLLSAAIAKLVIASVVSVSISLLAKAIKTLAIAKNAAVWVAALGKAILAVGAFLTAHPLVALATLVAAAILSIALSSERVVLWLEKIKQKLAEVFGIAVEVDKMEDVEGEFDDWANGITDIGDAAEDAADQLKLFLAPFDELIRIPDDFGEGFGSDFVGGDIDIPDIDEEAGTNVKNFFQDLLSKIGELRDVLNIPLFAKEFFKFPPFPPSPVMDLQDILEAIANAFAQGAERIGNNWGESWDDLGVEMATAFDGMVETIGIKYGEMVLATTEFTRNWKTRFENSGLVTVIDRILSDIGTTINSAYERFKIKNSQYITSWKQKFQADPVNQSLSEGLGKMGVTLNKNLDGYIEDINSFVTKWRKRYELFSVKKSFEGALENMSIIANEKFAELKLDINNFVTRWQSIFSLEAVKSNLVGALALLKTSIIRKFGEYQIEIDNFVIRFKEKFSLNAVNANLSQALLNMKMTFIGKLEQYKLEVDRFLIKLREKFSLTTVKEKLKTSLDDLKTLWSLHKEKVLLLFGILIAGIVGIIAGIPAAIITGVIAIFAVFTTELFDKLKERFERIPGQLIAGLTGQNSLIANAASSLWETIRNVFSTPFLLSFTSGNVPSPPTTTKDTTKTPTTTTKDLPKTGAPTHLVTTNQQKMLDAYYDFKATITPDNKETVQSNMAIIKGMLRRSGYTAALATGGIVNKEALFRLGEGNKREAVIPLQDSSAMKPFAEAVAAEMGGSSGDTMYVRTLVIDDTDLRKLNRKLTVVSKQEGKRRDS